MPEIEWIPSPWHSKGWWDPPTNIAMHSTATTLAGTLATFGNGSTRKVSAHFTIDGYSQRIIQHVALDDRAWHAMGANDFAYGIEHVDSKPWGDHPDPWTYDASAWLLDYISEQHYQRHSVALAINDSTVRPHADYVATACPANLDWPRCIEEAGGSGLTYVSEAQFNEWRAALQKQLEDTYTTREDHVFHGHAGATDTRTPRAKRTVRRSGLIVPELPRVKRTPASAQAGHGKGNMKGDVLP